MRFVAMSMETVHSWLTISGSKLMATEYSAAGLQCRLHGAAASKCQRRAFFIPVHM